MRLFIFFSVCFLLQRFAYSQCCSPGNPVGGTTNLGILNKKSFRVISFYRYSFSEGYQEGNKKSNFSFVKNATYNYAGLVLSYGILNKLTFETELGYFINKSQTYNIGSGLSITGYGFNNAYASLKYNLMSNSEKPFEWTIGAGAKIPFTRKYQSVNNSELPRDVQSSTHAFGTVTQSFIYKGFPKRKIKTFLIHRFETNNPDTKKFKFGNFLMSSFFVTRQIAESNFTGILQVRHEYRSKDMNNITDGGFAGFFADGTMLNSSGGHLFFLSPQINYTIAQTWNLSLLADFPVYRYYNGTQLANKFALALYLSKDFGGRCEVTSVEKSLD